MGNHEEKALRWRRHEKKRAANPGRYKNPMQPVNERRLAQWAEIPDDDWDWIHTLPYYVPINEQWIAVHAGMMPEVATEDQKPNELMRIRYVKRITAGPHETEVLKMVSPNERGEMPEGAKHWTGLWTGPSHIVYGHYTYMDGYRTTELTLGIDTGCVHGGALTAAVFEGFYTIVQVQAKKIYAERKAWNDAID